MSVSTLRAKLLTKLNEMQSLKLVADYATSNPDAKFPYATILLREGEGEFADTSNNLRKRGYTVMIRQEQVKAGQGVEGAEDIITAVIDELEVALDMDTTLSGSCKYCRPAGWRAYWEDKEFDTRTLEILVDCFELVSSDC